MLLLLDLLILLSVIWGGRLVFSKKSENKAVKWLFYLTLLPMILGFSLYFLRIYAWGVTSLPTPDEVRELYIKQK